MIHDPVQISTEPGVHVPNLFSSHFPLAPCFAMPQLLKRLKQYRKAKSSSNNDQSRVDISNSAHFATHTQQTIDPKLVASSSDLGSHSLDELATAHSQSRLNQKHVDGASIVGSDYSREVPSIRSNVEVHSIPNHQQLQPEVGQKSELLPTVLNGTLRMGLAVAAEAANAFTPLKIAVGTLSVLLNNYDVSFSIF
jgi:hypothetical protein